MTSLTEREATAAPGHPSGHAPESEGELGTLELGYIGKAHGLAGEMRLVLHNPHSEAPDTIDHLILKRDTVRQEFELVSIRGSSKAYLVRLRGVESREAADSWKGATVYALRSELPELEPDEYYLSDLLGARVEGPDGFVGEVIDLVIHPTVDCIVIKEQNGRRLEQPLLDPWVESVEVQKRLVRLRSLDGLIE